MKEIYFITGISTDVGKTIVSAIVTEALKADYWKPIQTGNVLDSDHQTIKSLISNSVSVVHSNSYSLKEPLSPHVASKLENVKIDINKITEPVTDNHLVIEGAGGILVPLNDEDLLIDLIQPNYKVIVVSKNYLGSINHTLMTIEVLKMRKINVFGIIFNGEENKDSENIIIHKTGIKHLGRISTEPYFDKNVVLEYADSFRDKF